jgi:glycine/D-amino acid oxidase-like deaminating enzyme
VIRGDQYVFACGPWLQKMFPVLMKNRMRVPLGYVMYYGTPMGDTRFTYPNLPSFNFPGVTGWPVLPVDSRGFRVRGAVAAPVTAGAAAAAASAPRAATPATPVDPAQTDPDLSTRWASQDRLDGTRRFVKQRFPALANAPLLETRACHYEQSVNRDFIIDHVPDISNAWIAGVGQAEGFKFGPVVGEYIAQRVMGIDGDPALIKAFRMPTEEYAPPAPAKPGEEEL